MLGLAPLRLCGLPCNTKGNKGSSRVPFGHGWGGRGENRIEEGRGTHPCDSSREVGERPRDTPKIAIRSKEVEETARQI